MEEVNICLKQFINEEDYRKVNELKNICTEKADIFLKVELEYKLDLFKSSSDENPKYVNEFLYYSGDMLVGYLGIFSMGSDTAELTGMVHPLFRRQGIFRRLHNLAIDECRRRGFNRILLICDNKSPSGLAFIKDSGAVYSFSEYSMKLKDNYLSREVSEINLRKAVNSDVQEISRQNNIFFGVTSSIKAMPEEEEKRNRITYMIELDSKIIGKIRVDFSTHEGYIGGFGILPEYRGRGYGKQSLRASLQLLSEHNIHSAGLEVASQNKNALNLYKSCGFAEESVIDYYEAK